MQTGKLRLILAQVMFGHLLNPLWRSRLERRTKRGKVAASAVLRYLDRYAANFASIRCGLHTEKEDTVSQEQEKIYTLWLQGEDNAPLIVRSCIESMRRNSKMEVEVLDARSVMKMVDLPEYVLAKRSAGKIRPAHFADICRLDLLYRHGGVWMDATDFIGKPIEREIMQEPFFVYMARGKQRGSYSFVQNCFIRAEKGNPLIGGWRDAVLAYWKKENCTADYFIHQLIFKKLLDCNPAMASLFSKMPQLSQDPTHVLWFEKGNQQFSKEEYDRIINGAAFQKTEYKSAMASNPVAGSFAEALVNGLKGVF